jgi:hypothetical protein
MMTLKQTLTMLSMLSITSLSGIAMGQQSWMSPEVGAAWSQGFRGQGVQINIHDNFYYSTGCMTFAGQCHGAWVTNIAQSVAPAASVNGHQYDRLPVIGITPNKLNVFNLSYGRSTAYVYRNITGYDAQTTAIINYAQTGRAVISKAAGNDSIPVGGEVYSRPGQAPSTGTIDILAVSLAGLPSAILVGALSKNGTTSAPAPMANYSNIAGTSPVVQRNFLVVGVDPSLGFSGTSAAAPIISGYAAILGSKFITASPTAVVNQLLNTARTDTVVGYNPAIYGRGEASISRALAPASIR